jgi:hypothetical protein
MTLISFLCHMPPNAMPVSCNGKPAKLLFQPVKNPMNSLFNCYMQLAQAMTKD